MKRILFLLISASLFFSCMSGKFIQNADYDDIEAVYDSISFKIWRDSDKSNALIKLIKLGKTEEAVFLIQHNAFNLNYANKNNETAIDAALVMEDSDVIEALINHNAALDINIFIAITVGNIHNIDLLIQNGADINSIDTNENNVLHYAVISKNASELIPYLLNKGIPLEKQNVNGETPLYHAVKAGRIDAADVLIKNGANVQTKDKLNQNLYFAAVNSASPATVDFVHKFDININDTNANNETPVLISIEKNTGKVLNQLIKNGADIEKQTFTTPLWYAFEKTNNTVSNCLEVLVERGVNVNTTDKLGQTVLIRSVINNRNDLVSFFINSNANIDITDSNGNRAIHYAIQAKNITILHLLINGGADLLVKNKNGATLLQVCVNEDSSEMIDALLDSKRITVDYASSTGTTAAMQAYINSNGVLANYLIQKGASLFAKDNQGKTLKTYRVNYYQEQISKANNQISSNSLTITVLQKDNVTAQSKISSLRIELSSAQANYERTERELQDAERKLREIQNEADRHRNDMNFYTERINFWTQSYNDATGSSSRSLALSKINEYKSKYNDSKRRYDERSSAARSVSLETIGKSTASVIAAGVVAGVEKKIREQENNISSNNSKINNLNSENKKMLQNIQFYQQEISKY